MWQQHQTKQEEIPDVIRFTTAVVTAVAAASSSCFFSCRAD